MKVRFENIPCETTLVVFDEGKARSSSERWTFQPGDSDFDVPVPSDWDAPYRVLMAKGYVIQDAREPIEDTEEDLIITGDHYYRDIDREAAAEEENQASVEKLISQACAANELDGRQKFYVALVSLQSYFEHLVYGMLVLSGHSSKGDFKALRNHEARTAEAFSAGNTEFLSTAIDIRPGSIGGSPPPESLRDELKKVFDRVRTLRNRVVHAWSYRDVGRDEIEAEFFIKLGEHTGYHETDDDFYASAAFNFVRLYARASPIRNQLSLFREREIVRAERESRGYT